MIISRTPFRVSLFGGGSDYPKWYRQHGGAVLGFAIDKYCYISVRPLPQFFEHRHRIVYSEVECVNDIADIQHPAVRAVLQDQKVDTGLEIHHDGDLPARSGLGSSSSFTVGMLNALYALRGAMIDKQKLAQEAIRIEQRVIGEAVGSQDQVWAAFGGINRIDFPIAGDFQVRPLVIPGERRQELIDHVSVQRRKRVQQADRKRRRRAKPRTGRQIAVVVDLKPDFNPLVLEHGPDGGVLDISDIVNAFDL